MAFKFFTYLSLTTALLTTMNVCVAMEPEEETEYAKNNAGSLRPVTPPDVNLPELYNEISNRYKNNFDDGFAFICYFLEKDRDALTLDCLAATLGTIFNHAPAAVKHFNDKFDTLLKTRDLHRALETASHNMLGALTEEPILGIMPGPPIDVVAKLFLAALKDNRKIYKELEPDTLNRISLLYRAYAQKEGPDSNLTEQYTNECLWNAIVSAKAGNQNAYTRLLDIITIKPTEKRTPYSTRTPYYNLLIPPLVGSNGEEFQQLFNRICFDDNIALNWIEKYIANLEVNKKSQKQLERLNIVMANFRGFKAKKAEKLYNAAMALKDANPSDFLSLLHQAENLGSEEAIEELNKIRKSPSYKKSKRGKNTPESLLREQDVAKAAQYYQRFELEFKKIDRKDKSEKKFEDRVVMTLSMAVEGGDEKAKIYAEKLKKSRGYKDAQKNLPASQPTDAYYMLGRHYKVFEGIQAHLNRASQSSISQGESNQIPVSQGSASKKPRNDTPSKAINDAPTTFQANTAKKNTQEDSRESNAPGDKSPIEFGESDAEQHYNNFRSRYCDKGQFQNYEKEQLQDEDLEQCVKNLCLAVKLGHKIAISNVNRLKTTSGYTDAQKGSAPTRPRENYYMLGRKYYEFEVRQANPTVTIQKSASQEESSQAPVSQDSASKKPIAPQSDALEEKSSIVTPKDGGLFLSEGDKLGYSKDPEEEKRETEGHPTNASMRIKLVTEKLKAEVSQIEGQNAHEKQQLVEEIKNNIEKLNAARNAIAIVEAVISSQQQLKLPPDEGQKSQEFQSASERSDVPLTEKREQDREISTEEFLKEKEEAKQRRLAKQEKRDRKRQAGRARLLEENKKHTPNFPDSSAENSPHQPKDENSDKKIPESLRASLNPLENTLEINVKKKINEVKQNIKKTLGLDTVMKKKKPKEKIPSTEPLRAHSHIPKLLRTQPHLPIKAPDRNETSSGEIKPLRSRASSNASLKTSESTETSGNKEDAKRRSRASSHASRKTSESTETSSGENKEEPKPLRRRSSSKKLPQAATFGEYKRQKLERRNSQKNLNGGVQDGSEQLTLLKKGTFPLHSNDYTEKHFSLLANILVKKFDLKPEHQETLRAILHPERSFEASLNEIKALLSKFENFTMEIHHGGSHEKISGLGVTLPPNADGIKKGSYSGLMEQIRKAICARIVPTLTVNDLLTEESSRDSSKSKDTGSTSEASGV